MLTLTIDRSADQPVYEQVADQLRRLMSTGTLPVGAVLPPVRRLAGDLGVNLNTVARAYRLLDEEGFLVIRDRAGAQVAAPAVTIDKSTRKELQHGFRASLARLRQAGLQPDELRRLVDDELKTLEKKRKESGNE